MQKLALYIPALGVLSGGITTWKHIYNHISKAAKDTGVTSPFNNGKGATVKDDHQWVYMVARKDQQQMALLHPVWNFHSRHQRSQARRGIRRQRLFIRSQPEERTHWPRKWFGLAEMARWQPAMAYVLGKMPGPVQCPQQSTHHFLLSLPTGQSCICNSKITTNSPFYGPIVLTRQNKIRWPKILYDGQKCWFGEILHCKILNSYQDKNSYFKQ